jgi:hypothetical protein
VNVTFVTSESLLSSAITSPGRQHAMPIVKLPLSANMVAVPLGLESTDGH